MGSICTVQRLAVVQPTPKVPPVHPRLAPAAGCRCPGVSRDWDSRCHQHQRQGLAQHHLGEQLLRGVLRLPEGDDARHALPLHDFNQRRRRYNMQHQWYYYHKVDAVLSRSDVWRLDGRGNHRESLAALPQNFVSFSGSLPRTAELVLCHNKFVELRWDGACLCWVTQILPVGINRITCGYYAGTWTNTNLNHVFKVEFLLRKNDNAFYYSQNGGNTGRPSAPSPSPLPDLIQRTLLACPYVYRRVVSGDARL